MNHDKIIELSTLFQFCPFLKTVVFYDVLDLFLLLW